MYIGSMSISSGPKDLVFRGSSLADLRSFPLEARREAGFQLDKVQQGKEPDDWKPFEQVGSGAKEIRVSSDDKAYRVLYVAKFGDAVYVLHCFQKTTQQTSKRDKELAEKRYRELDQELKRK